VIVQVNGVSASTTNGGYVSRGAMATHMTSRLSIITEETVARSLPPIHPGEVLAEEFLSPLGVTQYRLAKDTSVPARRINEIVKGERAISADTALRFAKYFGTSDLFWLNLQARYDLEVQRDRLGQRLETEVHVFERPAARRSSSVSAKRRTNAEQDARPARSALVRRAK
jgi:addiction module HigA family antidote